MGGKRDFIQNMGGIDLKKITPLLIGLVLLLVACGSGELDSFVEDFNQSARKYDATKLKENEFGEVETEDGEDWRNLFESKEYLINLMYDKKNIAGYYIKVESDETSIDKTGKGYNAVLTLADSLDLNISDLEKGMQAAFDDNFHDYEDGDYEVRISVINITSAWLSIMIEKK